MDIEDLKIFLEIDKRKNISTAAEHLHMTQSTVSRRLSALEKELGINLFIRGKGIDIVTRTAVADMLADISRQMIPLDEKAHALKGYKDMRRLSIASTDSLASYPLKRFFHEFPRQHPNLEIEMIISDSTQIFEMINNRMMDIGITNGSAPYPNLQSKVLFEEDFVVLRRGQNRSETGYVHPTELKANHEIFQFFNSDYQYWHQLWWPQAIKKFRVNQAIFTVNFLTEPEDWTILPQSVATLLMPEDGYITKLLETPPKRTCCLITKKGIRPDKKEVIEIFTKDVEDYFRK